MWEAVYSGVPGTSSGGPCSLERPTVFIPQRPHLTRHAGQLTLGSDSNSELHLPDLPEYVALSLFVMLSLTVALHAEMKRMARSVTKATSQATHAIREGVGQVTEIVLENRAAMNYLLPRSNHGCEEFKELLLYLTSPITLNRLRGELNKTNPQYYVQNGTKGKPFTLRSIPAHLLAPLPHFSGLREAFVIFLLFIILGVVSCCRIQCAPACRYVRH